MRQILAVDPEHADSLHILGIIACQLGRNDAAIGLIEKAIALNGRAASYHYSLGEVLRIAGRAQAAIPRYEQAISLNPNLVEAHGNLGNVLMDLGRPAQAAACFRRLLALNPFLAAGHNNLGNALVRQGMLEEAIAAYRKAVEIAPDFVEAHHNLGEAYQIAARLADAAAAYERALALRPNLAEAHNNLGSVLMLQGKFAEAARHFEKAVIARPDFAEAHGNLADAHRLQGRLTEAAASYERALSLRPDMAEAHNNLANVLQAQGKVGEAARHFEQAINLKPDFPEAQVSLAVLLNRRGEMQKAIAQCEQALSLHPDNWAARLALCMNQLPVLYMDESEIDTRRVAYREQLSALRRHAEQSKDIARLAEGVGAHQPFRLPYQGMNDRDLQGDYGGLICRIMAQAFPPAPMPRPPEPGEPVRVGIVSGYFRDHSNWKIPIKGWLTQLDRTKFELFGYHTGSREDSATQEAASLCRRFVRGPLSVKQWREAILADAPHVLIFPEVGMNSGSVGLAAQRLAPVQCNSWGHPETSGFPTLDYFLSSELMEPPDGDTHYTERLVRLPNLSVYWEPPEGAAVALSRSELGLRAGATAYWCGQSLFKYLPQYDHILPLIARSAGDCQFVFVKYPDGEAVNQQFGARLTRSFSALGLSAKDYCVVLPRLNQTRFAAAAGQCDVVLDSIGWSGCNSTLEVLANDLPVVTVESPFMRGRHGAAILTMIGVRETIAANLEEYVNIAVRLARDAGWRSSMSAKVRDNKYKVYRDRACIAFLENFLDAVARKPST